jgi:hypothetical protein
MIAMEYSIEQISKDFSQLCQDMAIVKELLLNAHNVTPPPEPDRWFDLKELVAYDPQKRSIDTFYGYTRERTIPFHKGEKTRKLLFLKSEIDLWLKQGKQKTIAEISAEADYVIKKWRTK